MQVLTASEASHPELFQNYIESSIVHGIPIQIIRSPKLWIEGEAVKQLEYTATLPGVERIVAMPDLHPGKICPVGITVLTRNTLIPILVDKDIGCGMTFVNLAGIRINVSKLKKEISQEFYDYAGISWDTKRMLFALGGPYGCMESLVESFPKYSKIIQSFLRRSHRLCEVDLGSIDDLLDDTTLKGCIRQMGSIGGGNHFIEIQNVIEITDRDLSKFFGLEKHHKTLTIHSGSRQLGYHLAKSMEESAQKTRFVFEKGTLDFERYLCVIQAGINFAALNRLVLLLRILDFLKASDGLVYLDKPHNYLECANQEGEDSHFLHHKGTVAVHHNPNSPDPVIISGSMGNPSWFAAGASNTSSLLNCVNHGVGRKWTRTFAKGKLRQKAHSLGLRSVTGRVEYVFSRKDTVFEEGGDAYKDVESVMEHSAGAGLITRIAKLDPVFLVKE